MLGSLGIIYCDKFGWKVGHKDFHVFFSSGFTGENLIFWGIFFNPPWSSGWIIFVGILVGRWDGWSVIRVKYIPALSTTIQYKDKLDKLLSDATASPLTHWIRGDWRSFHNAFDNAWAIGIVLIISLRKTRSDPDICGASEEPIHQKVISREWKLM